MLLDVFGGIVKGGVVNISVFALPQAMELRGPVNSNFTLIDCEVLVHDITSALTVTAFLRVTLDGLIPIAT